MKKLFESRDVHASTVKTIPDADAEIIFTRAPFIKYEQILLDKNFRQHLETIMVFKKIIRMGAQKTPIQKTYEISVVPLVDYIDNPIYRELPTEEEYYAKTSDERVYLDLRASSGYVKEAEKLERNDSKPNLEITLNAAALYNLRLRVWAYSLSEYLYVLSKNGLTLKH